MRVRHTWIATVALAVGAETVTLADVLVLRDGRRLEGVVTAVDGDTVEFESGAGFRRRVRQFPRREVRSIEFDDGSADRYTQSDRVGARERSVQVEAGRPWTDTGIAVRRGQEVAFSATGRIRWGPGRTDGPAGERGSPYNAARPMPDRNAAALIGKIGEDGDPFFIGDDPSPLRMVDDGRLFLGVNDDYLIDNSGGFRVRISY